MFARSHRMLIRINNSSHTPTLRFYHTPSSPKNPQHYHHGTQQQQQQHQTIAVRSLQTKVNLFKANTPGSIAFAESETNAVYDLFNHHTKKHGGIDEEGRYLCKAGVKELLCSIGERYDDETLHKLFTDGDINNDGKLHLTEFLSIADKVLGESPARFVFVVGGPGSGKGQLCARLAAECGVSHISSGDLLRNEISLGTPLGKEVTCIMDKGELVPSDIITAILRRRMKSFPGQRVLLDGFPRSMQNCIDFAASCGKPEMAILLDCDDTVMMERIIKRGAAAEGGDKRGDDNIMTALQRIRNYHRALRPVMDWLNDEHVPIVRLDVSRSRENVWGQLEAIGRLMRPISKIPPV